MRYFTLFVLFTFPCLVKTLVAQPGCTDPQATNFTAAATQNDGSCLYPVTNYVAVTKTPLSTDLNETSGLVMINGTLWTHNDSDNAPEIYQVDTLTNAIIRTVTVGGATVVDWEDITFDGTNLYIGDFGNNAQGNRTDLKVYTFPLSAIPAGAEVTVPETAVEMIQFSYEDQQDFTPQGSNHTRFDCEAMIFWGGQLHLFTKDWLDNNTTHYTLPATPGTYQAVKQETFFANGLVTGADITATGVIALCGYRLSSGENFIWLLFDYPGNTFFSGNKRPIELGSVLLTGQIEGICFRNNGYGYLSNEKVLSIVPARLYAFSIGQWLPDIFLPVDNPVKKNDAMLCRGLPNLLEAHQLPVLSQYLPANTVVTLWDTWGRKTWQGNIWEPLPANLGTGRYFLQVTTQNPATGCARVLVIK